VRLILCDDHLLFVEPLAAVLRMRGHEAIVASDPATAVELVDGQEPDLCLVDLHFPHGKNGLQAIAEIHAGHPNCPVVVLSASAEARDGSAARRAGAAGFIRKDQPVAAIFDAIERVASGRRMAVAPVPRRAAGSPERSRVWWLLDQLTDREREVLRRLVQAEDTVRIARSLGVAPSTARTHLQNVLLKLGVHTRLQAVALVVGAGVDSDL
jgi:two-component system nitrate/nitrite response regulator NarL